MSGADIAAEVAAALVEAATDTGTGRLFATLRKRTGPAVPWTGADLAATDTEITVLQVQRKIRDGLNMTERTVRMLLISTLGTVPAKGDQVAVGIAPAAVTDATVWARLGEVEVLAPGGTALLYKAMMEE